MLETLDAALAAEEAAETALKEKDVPLEP